MGVLDDVRERLGDGVVRRRLHRLGRPLREGDVELDRERRSAASTSSAAPEPALGEDRRVDPLGELAQLGERLSELLQGLLEQLVGFAGDGRAACPEQPAARGRAPRVAAGRRRAGCARCAAVRCRWPRRSAGATPPARRARSRSRRRGRQAPRTPAGGARSRAAGSPPVGGRRRAHPRSRLRP